MSEFSEIVAVINARAHYAASPWTEERIARLKAMAARGMTRGEMARELGLSRNAVIGACHRLGLSVVRKVPSDAHTAYGLFRAKRNAQARARTAKRKELGLPAPPRPPRWRHHNTAAEPVELAPGGSVDITGLTATTCRWPLWEDRGPCPARAMYCGDATVPELSYCPIHMKMGLQATRWKP